MNLSKNKVLITGGASGIGRGLTERFIKEGNAVIVCGRRADVLEDLAREFPAVFTKKCDLASPADRESLYKWIAADHSDLNVLVNNAGIQNWMSLDDKDFYQRARQEIEINIEAPLHLSALFLNLPSLRTIINVTSGLAFVPLTKVPVYSATKAFFHSFTLSMRQLLKARNIEVIELIPPALNTDLGGKGLHIQHPPVSDFVTSVFQQLKEGKTEIAFGFSANAANASPDDLRNIFTRMNS
jgi:uncharacterized oxidoreductase